MAAGPSRVHVHISIQDESKKGNTTLASTYTCLTADASAETCSSRRHSYDEGKHPGEDLQVSSSISIKPSHNCT